ncbi:hypothetical protein BJF80_05635 [Serinicoccus sp. CUA-874]|uniref:restriction system modified-DNA reader domain-containing protein n=1 Tax=Serinicoccus sp. CUA-874 TaxID=1517939 RepID=UPI00095D70D6|nr:CBS domain-containing protein [Serinicoccus sp. CUA-874]OLT16907.1 hypothetical protein BJF80_05635 [Serinicoccus sp. CUA-874]
MTTDRSRFLLEGRRVRVADLIQANLLGAGTDLEFHRPRLAERHHAKVLADGRLALEDGRTFASPSRAAGAAIGGAVDGWYAWRVIETGDLLAHLRQRLLDSASGVDGTAPETVAHPVALARHDFLRRAREAAESGCPLEMSVRELISYWSAKTRGQVVTERIENDLDNYGLITDPQFRKVGLDSRVAVAQHVAEDVADELREGAEASHSETDSVQSPLELRGATLPDEVGITLGNIPSASTDVVAVNPGATYEEAITLMLLNDFSQLAVMNAPPRGYKGAVTWKSIAREQHSNPGSRLVDAVTPAKVFSFDTELIDVLPTLQEQDFVFVEDAQKRITGIVTAADVVQAYGQLATPFFLMGELDQLLRRIVRDAFSMDIIRSLCDEDGRRKLRSHDELTMGDYQRILQNDENWKALDWPLDRSVFDARLDELRQVRNDIMHFNPDPIPEQVVAQLRMMIRLLKRFA